MSHDANGHASLSAEEALKKLQQGNEKYINASSNPGDVSPSVRKDTSENGQHPYAIVITCADSRVIPEAIFSAGIGELFVIRDAGNVMDDFQIGSVEYAAGHLGTNLVVVLGHTQCGAVGAALSGGAEGFIKSITDEIKAAIGDEKDAYKASCLNVRNSIEKIEKGLQIPAGEKKDGLRVVGAIYHIEDGSVEFLK